MTNTYTTNLFKDKQKEKQILDPLSLKLLNKKYEEEYEDLNKSERKFLNLVFIYFSLILSIIVFSMVLFFRDKCKKELLDNNLKLFKLRAEDLKILLLKNIVVENEIFYECCVLIDKKKILEFNENILNENINEIINEKNKLINKDNIIDDFIDKLINSKINFKNDSFNVKIFKNKSEQKSRILVIADRFIKISYRLSLFLIIYNFSILILIHYFNNDNSQKLLFVKSYFMFGFNFHLISGFLIVYYKLSPELLFFIIAVKLFMQIILTGHAKIFWGLILISSIISIIIEWIVMPYFHHKIRTSTLFYLSGNTVAQISYIVLAYYREKGLKNEFYLIKNLNYERNYLMNFLFNMSQGFITFNKSKNVLFVNKVMDKIINEYNSECKSDENENTDFKNSEDTNLEDTEDFAEDKFSASFINKTIINKILLELVEINPILPLNIKTFIESKQLNLEQLFDLINDSYREEFSEFVNLGVFNNSNYFNNLHNSDNSVSKKFQVNFRMLTHEDEDDFLEIIFNDVTEIVQAEREKAVVHYRSMYLSKIAHELKNPINSLMEINFSIKEEIKKKSNLDKILELVNFSEIMYKVMAHFLNAYIIFINLKFPCQVCLDKNLILCETCFTLLLCNKCKICKTCEDNKIYIIDYENILKEGIMNFEILAKCEQRDLTINYINNNFNENKSLIKTNKEILIASFYNIINHIYKTSNNCSNKHILIQSKEVTNNLEYEILFEIYNEGHDEIDYNFLEKIKHHGDIYTDLNSKDDELKSDKFNKYFNLFVGYFMIKKLGSNLKIENVNRMTKFYFSIKSGINENIQISAPVQIKQLNISNSLNKLEPENNFNNKIKHILIVDDENLIRNILTRYLNKINPNFIVNEASNCFDALNILYKKYLENIHFDMIIVDEYMPNMKGSTMINLLRHLYMENNFYKMRIVSHTAFDNEEKKKFILKNGADFILGKPINYEAFKNFINNNLL